MPYLLISVALHVGLLYLLSTGGLGGQDGDKDGQGKSGHVKVKLLDKPTDTESKNEREKVPEDKGIVIKKEDALPPEQRVVDHKCEHFYTGIGVQNDGTRNCTITGVPKGYPADRAGLRPGDFIVWQEAERVYLLGLQVPGFCECCGFKREHIFTVPSQTLYEDDEMNEDRHLCLDCAIWYTEDIEDRWRGYWSGLL